MVTGASSGEFTLWNGLTFNFETILQVDSSIEISVYFLEVSEHVLGIHLHLAHHGSVGTVEVFFMSVSGPM